MYCLDFPAVKHIIKYILLFLGLREERKTKRLIAILAVVLGISSLPCLAACPTADLNGNCFVDFEDFVILANQWLTGNRTDANMVLILASSSQMGDSNSAEYVCNGVNDQVQIQAAINSGFSHLKLSEGNYDINSVCLITSAQNGLVIEGSGPNTILTVSPKIQSSLTADFLYTATSVSVASTAGFIIGQHCTIVDDTTTGYDEGVTVKITDIPNSTTLTVSNIGDGIDSLHSNAKTYLISQNARIFTSFSAIRVMSANDVTVKNLTINGNAANNTVGNFDNWQNSIEFLGCQRPKVENVNVYNCVMIGVLGYKYGSVDSNNLSITNCYFEGGSYKGAIHFHGSDNSIVSNCRFFNNVLSIYNAENTGNLLSNLNIIGGAYGIYGLNSDYCGYNNINISNIRGDTTGTIVGTIAQGISLSNCLNNNLQGININSVIAVTGYGAQGIGISGPHIIVSNAIIQGVKGPAINAGNAPYITIDAVNIYIFDDGANGILFNTCANGSVNNCKVMNYASNGYGIDIYNSPETTVTNSNFTERVDGGDTWSLPSISCPSANCVIANNSCVNAGSLAIINVTGANCIVNRNAIISTDPTPVATSAALSVTGPTDVVMGNYVFSATRNNKILVSDPCSVNMGNLAR